jgi:hypothetical protein
MFISTVCQRIDHQSGGRGNYSHLHKENWLNQYRTGNRLLYSYPLSVSALITRGAAEGTSPLQKDEWLNYHRTGIRFPSTLCQRLSHQSGGRGNYSHLRKDKWLNYYRIRFPSTVCQRLDHQRGGRGNYSHLQKDKWLNYSGLWIRIHFLRIRIQSLMVEANTDPDPDPIRNQGFNDQKLKKNYS